MNPLSHPIFQTVFLLKSSRFLEGLHINLAAVPTWFDNTTNPPTLTQIGTAAVAQIQHDLTKWRKAESGVKAKLLFCQDLEQQLHQLLADVAGHCSSTNFIAVAQGGGPNHAAVQGQGNLAQQGNQGNQVQDNQGAQHAKPAPPQAPPQVAPVAALNPAQQAGGNPAAGRGGGGNGNQRAQTKCAIM